ncbi:MAG TPA: hypothetical protein VMV92_34110 [Streptosporangiaceae bacterium]|nr:hypothetical protein [Streptosporangiaceae bacterium]
MHAARPGAIRALQLDDADLDSRRLRLAGTDRPMGELTCKVVREWLEYRQHRWPHTANPHLLLSKESALHHGPVSTPTSSASAGCPPRWSGCGSTASSPKPWATGFDPLHLAEVFGISEHTAIRYAVNTRQLLGTPHQAAAPSSSSTPGPVWENRRAGPLSPP